MEICFNQYKELNGMEHWSVEKKEMKLAFEGDGGRYPDTTRTCSTLTLC